MKAKRKLSRTPKVFRIAVYTRVSTEEQAVNPEGSIKNQEMRLREFVKLKNMVEPFGEITQIFSDPGVSAKDMNRPGFQKMLAAIEQGEIDLVLVTELSRFSRSTKDFSVLQEFLDENGCKFMSHRENFDTSGAAGSMVLNMMASIAEFERRQTAERVSGSFLARAKRGLYNGGSVPLGYRIDDTKPGHLAIDSATVDLVRLAFNCFLEHQTLAATAKALNSKHLHLPKRIFGGGGFRSGKFTIDALYRMLQNKAYLGIRAFNTKEGVREVPAVWERIIDDESFERVNRILKKNRHHKRTHLDQRYPYTLSGLLFCATCSGRLCGKSSTGANRKVGYYEHIKIAKEQAISDECVEKHEPHRVPSDKIEPLVWQEVKKFILKEDFAFSLFKKAQALRTQNDEIDPAVKIAAKLKLIDGQIEVLAERIGALPKGMDIKPIVDQLTKLQLLSASLSDQLIECKKVKPAPADVVDVHCLNSFRKGLQQLINKGDVDKTLQTSIIKKVVHRLKINPTGFEVCFHIGQSHFQRELGGNLSSRVFSPKSGTSGALSVRSHKKGSVGCATLLTNGDLDASCTHDLQFRKPLLYLSELRGHMKKTLFGIAKISLKDM